ncbi:MAG TPA: Ig-like domain-containing protein [Planctomycetota bacterium]
MGAGSFNCDDANSRVICLESCNLGCTSTGCARTDIAQNEIIILQFSEDIDPASVTSSSVRFRTAAGNPPVGELFVNGKFVEFVPTLSISGGQTYFGFAPGETYTMTIIGGEEEPAVVRGTSGKPFGRTLTCTLASTNGIVDLNQVPPYATLVRPTPSQVNSAPRTTDILLEFNELIDPTPFLGGTQIPVTFSLRRTRPGIGGAIECDPASQPQTLVGSPNLTFDAARGISVLQFQPAQLLPGNVCVEIGITDGVRDMSGRSAQPDNFSFVTEVVPLEDRTIEEPFDNADFLDRESSAAKWEGGTATFARIGGDGTHGTLQALLEAILVGGVPGCTYLGVIPPVTGKRTFQISTDNTVIPEANTTTGDPISVSDGRFFFDKMVVPGDVRLRFVGNSAPVFTVVGRLDILGEIEVMGQSILAMPLTVTPSGQLGGTGGIFGGSGGQGGDKCSGVFVATQANNGRNGTDARVTGGHAYGSSVSGTGGRGSLVFPANGLNTSLYFGSTTSSPPSYCVSAVAGGSGGGYLVAGQEGRVVSNNHGSPPPLLTAMGPSAPGGNALQLFPYPVIGAQKSSVHFLVGGAGGGGSASNASFCLFSARNWAPGAGGGGGGGAIALRSGGSLRLASTGRILANGGSAANSPGGVAAGQQCAPAGGGSGGSIVLQTGTDDITLVELLGLIDVRGGLGGDFNRSSPTPITPPLGAVVVIDGGNGSPGFVRFEMPGNPTPSQLPGMLPAATTDNVATLGERDEVVACRSNFYSTGEIFGPQYVHYEIHAVVDGVPTVFSDDPAISTTPALPGAPVRALWQAATLDLVTLEPSDIRPWRTSVRSSLTQTGIASDGLNGFRFMLMVDRTFAENITIDKVIVLYRV